MTQSELQEYKNILYDLTLLPPRELFNVGFYCAALFLLLSLYKFSKDQDILLLRYLKNSLFIAFVFIVAYFSMVGFEFLSFLDTVHYTETIEGSKCNVCQNSELYQAHDLKITGYYLSGLGNGFQINGTFYMPGNRYNLLNNIFYSLLVFLVVYVFRKIK